MVPGAFTYNVKRATASGGSYTVIAPSIGAAGFKDTTVTNQVTYYYVITAVNADGESVNSVEVSATPRIAPPTGLQVISQ